MWLLEDKIHDQFFSTSFALQWLIINRFHIQAEINNLHRPLKYSFAKPFELYTHQTTRQEIRAIIKQSFLLSWKNGERERGKKEMVIFAFGTSKTDNFAFFVQRTNIVKYKSIDSRRKITNVPKAWKMLCKSNNMCYNTTHSQRNLLLMPSKTSINSIKMLRYLSYPF